MRLGMSLLTQQRPRSDFSPPKPKLFHTGATQLEYREKGTSTWLPAAGDTIRMIWTDWVVHKVEFTGLSPDTGYEFRLPDHEPVYVHVTYQQDPTTTMTVQWVTELPMESSYPAPVNDAHLFWSRTMPSDLTTRNVKLAFAGDVSSGLESLSVFDTIAQNDVDLFVLGGDIAYAEDDPDKVDRFEDYFRLWMQSMKTDDGRLIPVVAVIGNHELYGGGGQGRYGRKPADIVNDEPGDGMWFAMLYAFPGWDYYGILDAGDYLSLALLDSEMHRGDYLDPQDQAAWLDAALSARSATLHTLVSYHRPGRPFARATGDSYVTDYYAPVFEAHGVRTVFENHDHVYGRTPYIKDGAIDPTGVKYFGVGTISMVSREVRNPETTWWIEDARATAIQEGESGPHADDGTTTGWTEDDVRHFFLVTLKPTERTIDSVSAAGELFHTHTETL